MCCLLCILRRFIIFRILWNYPQKCRKWHFRYSRSQNFPDLRMQMFPHPGAATGRNSPVSTLLTWIDKITVLFNHVSTYCIPRVWRVDRVCSLIGVRTCETRLDTTTKFMVVVTSLFNLVILSLPAWQHVLMHEHGCWFIMMVPTTLFKSVRSSSHQQSVPTCMNKPVNNHVQAGQLNHVQACQQPCSSWPAQPCSSWPAQPCSSLSTTLFKLASSTMFKPVNNTVQSGQLNHVQACQQHCSFWPAQPCSINR